MAETILAQACENESNNAKRMRMGLEPLPAHNVTTVFFSTFVQSVFLQLIDSFGRIYFYRLKFIHRMRPTILTFRLPSEVFKRRMKTSFLHSSDEDFRWKSKPQGIKNCWSYLMNFNLYKLKSVFLSPGGVVFWLSVLSVVRLSCVPIFC